MVSTRIALVVTLAAVAAAFGCKDSTDTPRPDGTTTSSTPSAQTKPELSLDGVDTNGLTQRERGIFATWATAFPAPCADVAVPIAQCIQEKRACAKCVPAAKALVALVRAGRTREEAQAAIQKKFNPAPLPIDGSPTFGPDDAPVTIVEFADFQCPTCAAMMPIVDKALEAFKGKVRLVHKFVALPMHTRADPAARAAIAAWRQGKFWEMHHKLFDVNFRMQGKATFEQADLEQYARELKLDMTKFENDMRSPEAADRMARDGKLFKEVDAPGTPAIYVDGAELKLEKEGDLERMIEEALAEKDAGAKAAPGAVDAAAPSADAAPPRTTDAAPPADAASDAKR